MNRRLKQAALAVILLTLPLAGCNHAKKTSTVNAVTTTQAAAPSRTYHSRPDLKPPLVRILTAAHETAPGYVFIAPKLVVAQAGPLIMDNRGEAVWFKPLNTRGVTDFRVQHYRGKPVLTWWRGHVSNAGVGDGWYVIYDTSYRPVAEVRPGNGLVGDVHEFLITKKNTALFTVYHRRPVDLSSVGGPKEGSIWEGIVQEVDIATRRVLFEWHSYPQVALGESYALPPKAGPKSAPYDYFHINSIDVEPNGNLLVSARNTHAVYEIDYKTKKVVWRLGGKKSNFKLGPGTRFAWQHDARRQANGTITLFDNGATTPVEKFSRALVLRADATTKTVTLVRSYHHPKRLLAPFEGNAQLLPNGDIFVGWGAQPYVSEFSRSGALLFDVYFGQGKPPGKDADTYRAYRFPWHGQPRDRPVVVVAGDTAYSSWNGATEVRRWRVLAGPAVGRLLPVQTVAKNGFETPIRLDRSAAFYAVKAIGRNGKVLGTSAAVAPRP
ncbi:MAG TPA: arylsulfotransferase family protein [Gaiellaceae bacterium]|nr:arylsulfotransferase family protein [Gaiellaceae bacterium]